MKNSTLRNNDAKQIRKIRQILKAHGYLRPRINPVTEADQVRTEGRA